MRFGVKDFQFFVEFSETFCEIILIRLAIGDADIASGVEAPALRFNVRNGRYFAEPGYINVGAVGEFRRHQFPAVVPVFNVFAPMQPRNVGQELNLLRREFSVRPADLLVNMACINEQHPIRPIALPFGLGEEPEGAGQRDGVKEVRPDTDHHVNGAGFDNLPADFQFRGAGIGGRIRHDKARTTEGVECAKNTWIQR